MTRDGIDTSLRTEDLLKENEEKQEESSTTKDEAMSSKEISIDFLDMLQEMQDEKDSKQMKLNPNGDSDCISLGLSMDGETDDFDGNAVSPQQHMGSNLNTEEFPSSNRFESWWNSNSSNFRDGWGSFRKKMNGSLKNRTPTQRRGKSTEHDDDTEYSPHSDPEKPLWQKKKVRFKNFDTVFPFHKSFSRLHRHHGEDEANAKHF